jgi:hypothetical protein
MSVSQLLVEGPESSVAKFRDELLADLKRAAVPADSVDVSEPTVTAVPITEPAGLGHVEWVEIAITIGQTVVTAGLTELVKGLIKKHLSANKLKAEEADSD